MTRAERYGAVRMGAGAFGAIAAVFFVSPTAAAYGYVFSTFTGDDAAGMKLSIYTSADALNFTLLSNTGFGGPSGYLRDPSIMKYVDDGKYYVAYTDPLTDSCCGEEDHFSIASSTDLVHWTHLALVSAGVTGVKHAWAPEWFIEGATVHLIANIDTLNTDSDFKPYLFTAEDSSLTSWSAPIPLGIGPNYIDTFVLKMGATYHLFAKNETTRYCEHATASQLTGPWTFVGTGNWAGWGSGMEGPAVVQLDDGTWRIFMDGQGSTPFVAATSSDLNRWTTWLALPGVGNVVRHGTVIRDIATGEPSDDGGTLRDGADDEGPDARSGDAAVVDGNDATIRSTADAAGTGADRTAAQGADYDAVGGPSTPSGAFEDDGPAADAGLDNGSSYPGPARRAGCACHEADWGAMPTRGAALVAACLMTACARRRQTRRRGKPSPSSTAERGIRRCRE